MSPPRTRCAPPAGLTIACGAQSPTCLHPSSQVPAGSRTRRSSPRPVYGHAWHGELAAAGTALAVPLREQRQACPCPYVHALLSAPAAKASQPGRLLCFASAARQPCVLRPRLYTHSIQFKPGRRAESARPAAAGMDRDLSLSLCSPLRLPPLSPRRRAVPPRPARPDGDADPCVLASRTVLCYCPIIQYGLDFPDADELLATTSNKTMSGYCHLRCGACHQGPCPPTTLLRDQSELRTSLSSSSSSSTTSSSMVAFNRDGGWFLRAELSGFRNQERECERFLFLRC